MKPAKAGGNAASKDESSDGFTGKATPGAKNEATDWVTTKSCA